VGFPYLIGAPIQIFAIFVYVPRVVISVSAICAVVAHASAIFGAGVCSGVKIHVKDLGVIRGLRTNHQPGMLLKGVQGWFNAPVFARFRVERGSAQMTV